MYHSGAVLFAAIIGIFAVKVVVKGGSGYCRKAGEAVLKDFARAIQIAARWRYSCLVMPQPAKGLYNVLAMLL